MRAQLAKIHIAKKELGLADETYQDILERLAGQRTAKGLSQQKLDLVLAELKRLGWQPSHSKRKLKAAAKPYQRLIHALWRSCKDKGVIRDGSRKALRAFVEKRTGVSDPDFLSFNDATPIIEALKEMEKRA